MRKLIVVLGLTFAGAAWGQTGEIWFSYGESFLSNANVGTLSAFGGSSSDVKLDDGYRFSFRFGFNQGDHFGHEIQYAFNHTQFDATNSGGVKNGMHFHQGGYNFLYYLTSDKLRIRPFATAGVQFDDFVPPGGGISSGSQNKFGANFGAGVKFHVKGKISARVDVREYLSGKPNFNVLALTSGPLWQTEVSAGIGLGF
jgi:opacity protein-like surface antigen